jgi:hypothetical protein
MGHLCEDHAQAASGIRSRGNLLQRTNFTSTNDCHADMLCFGSSRLPFIWANALMMGEHFPPKWTRFGDKKMRQEGNLQRFPCSGALASGAI